MSEGICYIISGGDLFGPPIEKKEEDYVIAADAGYRHLEALQVESDMVIGDFDSIMSVPQHEYLVRLNKEKDDTDTLAAIRLGLEKGYKEFRIYGATGGMRIDHTLANIQTLAFLLDFDARGYLYNQDTIMTMIRDEQLDFDESYHGYISVFSYSEVSVGVNLRGLKYELTDATVTSGFPIGVSNEFTGVASNVSVKNGTLLVTYQNPLCKSEIKLEEDVTDEVIN